MSDVPAQPWKNGGGLTREVVSWPPGAGVDDFLWRISVARIDADGPFSRFAGIDRVITLLSGPGVLLRGSFAADADAAVNAPADAHALTTPLAPFAFSGDVDIDCALQGGPSEDFNVMSRRGSVNATVAVVEQTGDLPADLPAITHGLVLAVGSEWEVVAADGARHMLPSGAGLWWADSSQTLQVRSRTDTPNSENQIPNAANAGAGASGRTGLIVVAFDMLAPKR
ncbi:hypothetical protein ASB57_07885 [Bordetella sp. N]|nr:hypothetical protein ASB57_07885 [Bordetella sp. N]